jgi:hypothetical protein
MRPGPSKKWLGAIGSILLGLGAFFAVVGPRALYPTNIAWLSSGDPAQHFLGWHFYRNAVWSFPIGLNPRYGIELSNAILFSDSNPLLAFLFKPFSSVLPEVFQYFGIWLLACFILQAWLGGKLVGLISSSPVIRSLGSGLFAFAPPMIWRVHVHLILAGHFLVLAGLYLLLRPARERRPLLWGTVLTVAAMVHAYLLAMVAVLWLTDLMQVVVRGWQTWQRIALEFLGIAVVVGLTCWQVGYFSVGDGVFADGYGFYRMNLLSLVDPSGWSYVLQDIPQAKGEYEGFNFLGLGVLTLFAMGLPSLVAGRSALWPAIRGRWMLLLPLAGLFVFALSNKVGIGPYEFELVPLKGPFLQVANVFRSSGRMAWPVFYVLMFVAIFVVVRGNNSRVAGLLLSISLAIQIADTRAAWQGIRNKLMTRPAAEWESPLKNAFWDEAAEHYDKVRWIPPGNHTAHWKALSYYASRHGLATDAVYLARVGKEQLSAAREDAARAVRTGTYKSDSLYLLDRGTVVSAFLALDRKKDFLAEIDRFYVLAPAWNACAQCSRPGNEVKLSDLVAPIKLGERIQFSLSGGGSQYLASGWSTPGSRGTWSDGYTAEIVLPVSETQPARLVVEAAPLLSSSHPRQAVEIFVNGVRATEVILSASSKNTIEIPVPEEVRERLVAEGYLRLRFVLPDAVRPVDLGINADSRRLALELVSIREM